MVENEPGRANSTLIKRYANRRFYDTARLSYLSLDDLANMVLAQQRFEVRDAATGNDITAEILERLQ